MPGKINQGADKLSRNNVFSEEWMLHLLSVQKIWEVFGRARVDNFASENNSHCQNLFTKSTDALALEWPSLPLYAFPPIAQLPPCITTNACIFIQSHVSGLNIRTARRHKASIKDARDCWSNSRELCEKFSALTSEARTHTHTHTHLKSANTHI